MYVCMYAMYAMYAMYTAPAVPTWLLRVPCAMHRSNNRLPCNAPRTVSCCLIDERRRWANVAPSDRAVPYCSRPRAPSVSAGPVRGCVQRAPRWRADAAFPSSDCAVVPGGSGRVGPRGTLHAGRWTLHAGRPGALPTPATLEPKT